MKIVLSVDGAKNDFDDELLALFMAHQHLMGNIEIVLVWVNSNPAETRSKVFRGFFNHMGLHNVPVVVGSELRDKPWVVEDTSLIPYFFDGTRGIGYGEQAVLNALAQHNEPLVFVGTGGFKDIADLMINQTQFYCENVSQLVVQSGSKGFDVTGFLVPDGVEQLADGSFEAGAMNNLYHPPSAATMFKLQQSWNKEFTVVTKYAAYQAMLSHAVLEQMGELGHYFSTRARKNAQSFWEICCKKGLSSDRDRAFYVKNILKGPDPDIPDGGNIIPFLEAKNPDGKMQSPVYDLLAGLLATEMGSKFFEPMSHPLNPTTQLIGLSNTVSGITDPAGLSQFMGQLLIEASRFYQK